jgi:SAM-dependent methyltransferase
MFDKATLQYYSDVRPTYKGSGIGGISRYLNDFVARLLPGCRILELGCGGGLDAEALIQAGFDVDPTDGVASIAQQAEQRLCLPVRVMRFDQLASDQEYDAIWANASLIHVPMESLGDVLTRVHRALRPGGLHGATYKCGGHQGRDRHGRYYNYPSMEMLLAAYQTSGDWDLVHQFEYVGGGFEDGLGPWAYVVLRRRDSPHG